MFLGSAIIVFREVLEAALVVSIVMAGSKGVVGRGLWIGGGVLGGALGACVVAACARVIQPRSTATMIAMTPKPEPPMPTRSSSGEGSCSVMRSRARPLTGWAASHCG